MRRVIDTPTPTPSAYHASEGRRPVTPSLARRLGEVAAQAAALQAAASEPPRSIHRSPNTGGMGGCRASGG